MSTIHATKLTIVVPMGQTVALLDALEGRDDWVGVLQEHVFAPTVKPTRHEAMALHHQMHTDGAATRAHFRKQHPGYESAMPIAYEDAYTWLLDGAKTTDSWAHTPLSLPKLSPLTPALVARHFPGQTDAHGWWAINPEDDDAYQGEVYGWPPLIRALFGVPFLPYIHTSEPRRTTPNGDASIISMSWSTFNARLQGLDSVLRPVLATHEAKAIAVTFSTEANVHVALIDPDQPSLDTHLPQEGMVLSTAPTPQPATSTRHSINSMVAWNEPAILDRIDDLVRDDAFAAASARNATILP